jgi:hypothetical protein
MVQSQKSVNLIRLGGSSSAIGKLWASIEARIPLGYEDGTGFHYGTKPVSAPLERPSKKQTSEKQSDPVIALSVVARSTGRDSS